MQRSLEAREKSPGPEFTIRRPLPTFVVDTSGIPVNYQDPFNFSGLNLLGLATHVRNTLLRSGIESVIQLHEIDDLSLETRGIDTKKIDAAREAIERFRVNLQAYTAGASEATQLDNTTLPITINAIDWMNRHNLTWEGTPKTPLMLKIEEAVDQNLAFFLIETYIKKKLAPSSIAKLISAQSNGQINVTTDKIVQFMRQHGIKRRTVKEAQHVNPKHSLPTQIAQIDQFRIENARKGRIDKVEIQRVRALIGQAKLNGDWDKLSEREKRILSTIYDGDFPISKTSIARGLKLSKERIRKIAARALNKLESHPLQMQSPATGSS